MPRTTDITKYRFNHTNYRVKDPEVSLKFYTEIIGMTYLGKLEVSENKITLYFLAFEADPNFQTDYAMTLQSEVFSRQGVLELMHIWDTANDASFEGYHSGNAPPLGYGHIAITVDDLDAACQRVADLGVRFAKRPEDGHVREVAFICDPDGYWVELLVNPKLL
ncbi:Lactoylglutathione lyase [Dimargaris verticillata]|uniref:lactoylglutathione lyase n=1 Tax=Dimargaris verticillata TaxID=2761393 RepID=A0A9W8B7Y4_9FUNG|nr:Lactoylglutathione lyase [Dimargaris verticillata]